MFSFLQMPYSYDMIVIGDMSFKKLDLANNGISSEITRKCKGNAIPETNGKERWNINEGSSKTFHGLACLREEYERGEEPYGNKCNQAQSNLWGFRGYPSQK